MQTFLPYPDFKKSAQILDYRRLGKQRVEAFQLIKSHENSYYCWASHPVSKMWKGYTNALRLYMNIMIQEWIDRGYKNTMRFAIIENVVMPHWLGDVDLHASHRSNLLRKNYDYYSQFGWIEPINLKYVWK